ncbi:hypothetical protein Q1695_003541 [Nippostrongylus brasiliensis]|nr:hypothetical protein Q1695_003541 [Nippostrongylus brasiliensis]
MFQNNAKLVRLVLGEIQAQMNPRPRKPLEEIEKRDTNSEKDTNGDEKPRSDWSTLRAALEGASGSIGRSTTSGNRGAKIRSKHEKGYLEEVCKDRCFEETKLGEIAEIQSTEAFRCRLDR